MIRVNGRLIWGITLDEFMHLHFSHDFYAWLNLLRGARGRYHYWSGI